MGVLPVWEVTQHVVYLAICDSVKCSQLIVRREYDWQKAVAGTQKVRPA